MNAVECLFKEEGRLKKRVDHKTIRKKLMNEFVNDFNRVFASLNNDYSDELKAIKPYSEPDITANILIKLASDSDCKIVIRVLWANLLHYRDRYSFKENQHTSLNDSVKNSLILLMALSIKHAGEENLNTTLLDADVPGLEKEKEEKNLKAAFNMIFNHACFLFEKTIPSTNNKEQSLTGAKSFYTSLAVSFVNAYCKNFKEGAFFPNVLSGYPSPSKEDKIDAYKRNVSCLGRDSGEKKMTACYLVKDNACEGNMYHNMRNIEEKTHVLKGLIETVDGFGGVINPKKESLSLIDCVFSQLITTRDMVGFFRGYHLQANIRVGEEFRFSFVNKNSVDERCFLETVKSLSNMSKFLVVNPRSKGECVNGVAVCFGRDGELIDKHFTSRVAKYVRDKLEIDYPESAMEAA